jgi:hypothetical protein
MAGRVLPGDSEWGRGGSLASKSRELKWRLFLASKFSGLESHINPASCRRIYLVDFMASKSSGFKEKQSKRKEK